jgi:hypothetical protein
MSRSTQTEGTNTAERPAKVAKRDGAAQHAKRPLVNDRKPGKAKPEKLVCRYCGSDDLSPSFIKRRDRRCRKCFSNRYTSKHTAKKATKVRKK